MIDLAHLELSLEASSRKQSVGFIAQTHCGSPNMAGHANGSRHADGGVDEFGRPLYGDVFGTAAAEVEQPLDVAVAQEPRLAIRPTPTRARAKAKAVAVAKFRRQGRRRRQKSRTSRRRGCVSKRPGGRTGPSPSPGRRWWWWFKNVIHSKGSTAPVFGWKKNIFAARPSAPASGWNKETKRASAAAIRNRTAAAAAVCDDDDDADADMAVMMGFGGFGTTQGKHVDDPNANVSSVRKKTTRRARQYMNREGGFNRPLPEEKTGIRQLGN